jgi:hypothetical protein
VAAKTLLPLPTVNFSGSSKTNGPLMRQGLFCIKRSFVPGASDAAVSLPADKRGRKTAFRSGLKEAATCALLVRLKTPAQKLTRCLKFKRLKDLAGKDLPPPGGNTPPASGKTLSVKG